MQFINAEYPYIDIEKEIGLAGHFVFPHGGNMTQIKAQIVTYRFRSIEAPVIAQQM